ncbi:DUF6262 family protein [Cobetia sp. AM6]|uniref:DUF6262 family protein n=1 Tax=Cobetia sp. AM6 TaxID=2661553 RepID=UPI001298F8EC|nr:DUF6262 family protein [Cobetia sp. AM6]BBO56431.1 hypothetical protein CLAM6_17420 [Cobetia sp. AM6]
MSGKATEGLAKAREERSLRKRRAVEEAIATLKERNEAITFKDIAALAGVSRQYLYNNFKESISAERDNARLSSSEIDGVTVPSRTTEEYRHIEAVLRNKVYRLKQELSSVRKENARLQQDLEKERGRSEHFRKNWINTSTRQQ